MKIVHQGQDKEVAIQPEPQAWLPAPMLHGEPLMDSTSLRDFKGGGGRRLRGRPAGEISTTPCRYGRVGESKEARVFLSVKRYLGMVRLLTLVVSMTLVPWFLIHRVLVLIGRPSMLPIGWRRQPTTKAKPWSKSVTSAWMLLGSSRTPRLTS